MELDIGKIILEDEIDIGETKLEEEVDIGNIETDYQSEQIVTSNYEELNNLPKINNVEIIGNKSLEELGIKQEYTANDITFEDGMTFQEKYNSGELKGADGKDGTDGIDGYTPQKNVDYFDGKPGKDGSNGIDGVSCSHSWNGTTLTITSASGTSSANLKGEQGIQGVAGEDGYTPVKGKDYFDGINGQNGKDGIDGKTPIKGEDYYTEADKQEMVQLVLNALPSANEVSY